MKRKFTYKVEIELEVENGLLAKPEQKAIFGSIGSSRSLKRALIDGIEGELAQHPQLREIDPMYGVKIRVVQIENDQ